MESHNSTELNKEFHAELHRPFYAAKDILTFMQKRFSDLNHAETTSALYRIMVVIKKCEPEHFAEKLQKILDDQF